jgi:5-methylcytosine-specific restriction endonuclease McrA
VRAIELQVFIKAGTSLEDLTPEAVNDQRDLWQHVKSIKPAPSVARLVMEEQRRYWKENPEAKKEHDRWWAQEKWWLEYQTRPELRLYTRQKSKRRKAQMRDSVAIQVKGREIRARFAEFDHRCAYCGADGDLHIEHVVPISKGGPHSIGNIIPACESCNYSKRDHDIETWYRSQSFFSELRWRKICRVLGWQRSSVGQLALL